MKRGFLNLLAEKTKDEKKGQRDQPFIRAEAGLVDDDSPMDTSPRHRHDKEDDDSLCPPSPKRRLSSDAGVACAQPMLISGRTTIVTSTSPGGGAPLPQTAMKGGALDDKEMSSSPFAQTPLSFSASAPRPPPFSVLQKKPPPPPFSAFAALSLCGRPSDGEVCPREDKDKPLDRAAAAFEVFDAHQRDPQNWRLKLKELGELCRFCTAAFLVSPPSASDPDEDSDSASASALRRRFAFELLPLAIKRAFESPDAATWREGVVRNVAGCVVNDVIPLCATMLLPGGGAPSLSASSSFSSRSLSLDRALAALRVLTVVCDPVKPLAQRAASCEASDGDGVWLCAFRKFASSQGGRGLALLCDALVRHAEDDTALQALASGLLGEWIARSETRARVWPVVGGLLADGNFASSPCANQLRRRCGAAESEIAFQSLREAVEPALRAEVARALDADESECDAQITVNATFAASDWLQCPICYETDLTGSALCALACGHLFCRKCLANGGDEAEIARVAEHGTKWTNCAVCKKELRSEGAVDAGRSIVAGSEGSTFLRFLREHARRRCSRHECGALVPLASFRAHVEDCAKLPCPACGAHIGLSDLDSHCGGSSGRGEGMCPNVKAWAKELCNI